MSYVLVFVGPTPQAPFPTHHQHPCPYCVGVLGLLFLFSNSFDLFFCFFWIFGFLGGFLLVNWHRGTRNNTLAGEVN